jgi:hypothetical protein
MMPYLCLVSTGSNVTPGRQLRANASPSRLFLQNLEMALVLHYFIFQHSHSHVWMPLLFPAILLPRQSHCRKHCWNHRFCTAIGFPRRRRRRLSPT